MIVSVGGVGAQFRNQLGGGADVIVDQAEMFAPEAGQLGEMFFQSQRMAGQRVGASSQIRAGLEGDDHIAFDIFLRGWAGAAGAPPKRGSRTATARIQLLGVAS